MKKNLVGWGIVMVVLVGMLMSLEPLKAEVGDDVVVMKARSYEDMIEIDVMAEVHQAPLLGMGFHVEFDDERLEYVSFSEGDFFEIGGDPIYLVNPLGFDAERVAVGVSLRRGDLLAEGVGKVLTLQFRIKEMTGEPLRFDFKKQVASTLKIDSRVNVDFLHWEGVMVDFSEEETEVIGGIVDYSQRAEFFHEMAKFASLVVGALGVAMFMWIFQRKRRRFKWRENY